jgi:hypothetical protein
VGTLTAISVGLGQFLGKEAVEARAADLARDLARAIKEKRRYPATDQDLRYYQFMGSLVKSQKDTIMKHDFKHWQEGGLYKGFEAYIQQTVAEAPFDNSVREAWIQGMIEEQKARKKGQTAEPKKESKGAGPLPAKTCRELLRMMPLAFNASSAGTMRTTYQFEVSGDENFIAHLAIADGQCVYHDGPAEKPDVVVKTPADVWLKISRGELNGQKAFMEARYKVEGDVMLLLKLKDLFPG